MQWLTADIVFDGYEFHTDFFMQVNEKGEILTIQYNKPEVEIRYLKGLLMPGMVNAHCHLELSHSKGLIAEKTGLSQFLQNVSKHIPQKADVDLMQKAQQAADQEMYDNGIVAVGDICNTTQTIEVKSKSELYYHNLIECIAIRAQDVQKRFEDYRTVFTAFDKALSASLSLHTPYTCHEDLYKLVNAHSNFISIHNQESAAENLLFERKEGDFDSFYEHFSLDKKEIIQEQTLTSSFENTQRLLSTNAKKIFVHNTFTRAEDLKFADANTWFCFCPKANLYIEDQLPNIPIFKNYQDQIVLGTDSLASNDQLNILAEVKTIQDHFPEIPLRDILKWATSNGATLFGLEHKLGSFEVGKKPGLVQVPDVDIERRRLIGDSVLLV